MPNNSSPERPDEPILHSGSSRQDQTFEHPDSPHQQQQPSSRPIPPSYEGQQSQDPLNPEVQNPQKSISTQRESGGLGEGRPFERGKAPGRTGARGTAAMDPKTRQEVARKGGLAVSRNKQHMAEIGRKGGQSVSKNREHMAAIGRKGGAASRGGSGTGEGSTGAAGA